MASKSAIAACLKAQLVDAQYHVTELLESVIIDKKIRRIDQDGVPVAYVVPIDQYKLMNGVT